MDTTSRPRSHNRLARLILAMSLAVSGGALAAVADAVVTVPTAAHAESAVHGPITRSEIIARAQFWLGKGIQYSQVSSYPDPQGRYYRTDCSGYVSMAWHLNTSRVTYPAEVGYLADVSTPIGKDQLQPGDLMMASGTNGHALLFAGWADSGRTRYNAYEFGSTPVSYRSGSSAIPYPYWPNDGRSFFPYRYNNVIEDGASADVNARVVYRTGDGHIRMMSVGTSGWRNDDLTAISGGPAAIGSPFGYSTNMPPYGPVARVVYRSADGHIHDLAASASFGWNDHDLTALTGAPPSAVDPMGYVSNLDGQGPVARVVYRSGDGHIQMMSLGGSGWVNHDLTAIAGAPSAIGSPFGYSTNMAPYGQVARVVYRTGDGHLHDLAVSASFGWNDHDLTAITGAPPAMDNPFAYTTDLPGQGLAARIVYRTNDGHIHDTAIGASFPWNDHDLTAITGAAPTVVNPTAYTSDLDGQGQTARVVYKTGDGHIQMMSVGGSGWVNHDLTAITGTQPALGSPFGYSTNLADNGNVARVVYRTNDGHIHDLAVSASFPWNDHDLTAITGAPSTAVNPFGYTTAV